MGMKKINLQVKVTYTVSMECDVTDDIMKALECMQEEFPSGMNDDESCNCSEDSSKAFEWLGDKCKENDAYSWSFEIEDLTEE